MRVLGTFGRRRSGACEHDAKMRQQNHHARACGLDRVPDEPPRKLSLEGARSEALALDEDVPQ